MSHSSDIHTVSSRNGIREEAVSGHLSLVYQWYLNSSVISEAGHRNDRKRNSAKAKRDLDQSLLQLKATELITKNWEAGIRLKDLSRRILY